jgi:hypothetical protein
MFDSIVEHSLHTHPSPSAKRDYSSVFIESFYATLSTVSALKYS